MRILWFTEEEVLKFGKMSTRKKGKYLSLKKKQLLEREVFGF